MALPETEVSKEEVMEQLEKVKHSKSPRPDGIYPRVQKEIKCELLEVLTRIYNIF